MAPASRPRGTLALDSAGDRSVLSARGCQRGRKADGRYGGGGEIVNVTGPDDYLLHVAVADAQHLRAFVLDRLGERDEIAHLRASLIYEHQTKAAIAPISRDSAKRPRRLNRRAQPRTRVTSAVTRQLIGARESAATARGLAWQARGQALRPRARPKSQRWGSPLGGERGAA
jgi:hypothetical protein